MKIEEVKKLEVVQVAFENGDDWYMRIDRSERESEIKAHWFQPVVDSPPGFYGFKLIEDMVFACALEETFQKEKDAV